MRAVRADRGSTKTRAQALLEFALVLPFFLIILLALFEFGRALVEYTSLSNAAREGARAAIVSSKTITEITTAARKTAVTAGTAPTVTVTVTRKGAPVANPATRTQGDIVQVQVTHTFRPIAFLANGFGPDRIRGLGVSIPMGSTARMRVE